MVVTSVSVTVVGVVVASVTVVVVDAVEVAVAVVVVVTESVCGQMNRLQADDILDLGK